MHHPSSTHHKPPPLAPGPPPGLAGLACVPNSFCNPCTNPSTDPRPSNVDLFKCRVCDRLLHHPGCANPAVTLPCGNSLHRNCIPPTPSQHKPPNVAHEYFDCPFACCKLKAHLRAPEGVTPNCDAVLQHVVAKWADVNRTLGGLHQSLSSLSLSSNGSQSQSQCQSQSQSSSKTKSSSCACDPSKPRLLCAFCSALKAQFGGGSSASMSTCGSSSSSTTTTKSKSGATCTCQPPPSTPKLSSMCKAGSLRKLFKQTFCPKAKAAADADQTDLPAESSSSTTSPLSSDAKQPLSPTFSSSSSLSATSATDDFVHKPDCPLAPLPPLPPPVQSLSYSDFEDLLECQLCYQLLHDPVTLYPCGHTACRACILRTLDHAPRCFLCRSPLDSSSSYLTYHAHAPNRTLQKFVWHNFPRESWVRAQVLALEARELLAHVPIFVCSLALPGAPVHLHVFEPRYRLMMRRVTAPGAPRLFGMCMPDPRGLPGPAEFGVMLKVESLQWLPDGRCLVQAQAIYTIRLTSTGCTDGYTTAQVVQVPDADFLSLDDPMPGELRDCIPSACPATAANLKVRDLVCHASRKLGVFLERLPSVQARHQFLSQFGCMPCDPTLFAFWLAGVLPVPMQEKYKLLAMPSARDRLVTVMRWFRCVRDRCAPPPSEDVPPPPYSASAPQAAASASAQPPSAPSSPAANEPRASTATSAARRQRSLRRHHSSRSSMASDASMGETGDDDDFGEDEDMDEDEYDDEDGDFDDDDDMDVDSPRASSSSGGSLRPLNSSPGGRSASLVPPLPRHPAAAAPAAAANQAPPSPAHLHHQPRSDTPPARPPADRDDVCTIM